MKRSKFSEEQVAYALRQAESGTPVDARRKVVTPMSGRNAESSFVTPVSCSARKYSSRTSVTKMTRTPPSVTLKARCWSGYAPASSRSLTRTRLTPGSWKRSGRPLIQPATTTFPPAHPK